MSEKKKEEGAKKHATGDSSVPIHLVAVPATITAAKVQRLMHISHKMNQKLEGLLREFRGTRVPGGGLGGPADEIGEDGGDVVNGVQDVGVLFTGPAICAWETTVVRWVVVGAVYEVQWGGPTGAEADLVCPCGDRREVAWRVGGAGCSW
jgi:hypothetical protein